MIKKEKFKFCPLCGGRTTLLPGKFARLQCQECKNVHYLNPKVGVAVLIEINGSILLVRRKEEPFRGWWSLPAGYVEYEESCEDAAVREAYEETSATISLTSLFGVYSYTDDPRANMVLVVYRAIADNQTFSARDDVEVVQLFPISRIPEQLAFSGVRRAIQEYVLSIHK